MAAVNKGIKRLCMSCSTKFYDFNKSPIKCPNCGAEFLGYAKAKAKRGRPANDEKNAKAKAAEEEVLEDDDEENLEDSDTVSMDDVADDEENLEDDDELEEELKGDLDLDEFDNIDDGDEDDLDDDLDDDIDVRVNRGSDD